MPRPVGCKDPRVTVSAKDNMKEYQRQKAYIRNHPDCTEVPPVRRKGGIITSSDARITAKWNVDRTEYNRQKQYIQLHPDCSEIPPKKFSSVPTWLITVEYTDDKQLWQRQYQFLRKNPDAEYIPIDILNPADLVKQKNLKKGRDDGKSGTGYTGAKHKDPRITVRKCEDPVEYKRQLGYLSNHPECTEIPPRQRVNHRKNRSHQ